MVLSVHDIERMRRADISRSFGEKLEHEGSRRGAEQRLSCETHSIRVIIPLLLPERVVNLIGYLATLDLFLLLVSAASPVLAPVCYPQTVCKRG